MKQMMIYNTLSRRKEPFVPVKEGQVGIYACGPTVSNYFHIGNARPFIIFDTLRRFMRHLGYQVTFVQNFTDIDDKMIKRANEEGTTVEAVPTSTSTSTSRTPRPSAWKRLTSTPGPPGTSARSSG